MKTSFLCLFLFFISMASRAQFIPIPKPGSTTKPPETKPPTTPTTPGRKPPTTTPTTGTKPPTTPPTTESKPPTPPVDTKPEGPTNVLWFKRGAICVAKVGLRFTPTSGQSEVKCSELLPEHPDAILYGVSPSDCLMLTNFLVPNAELITIDYKDCKGTAVL